MIWIRSVRSWTISRCAGSSAILEADGGMATPATCHVVSDWARPSLLLQGWLSPGLRCLGVFIGGPLRVKGQFKLKRLHMNGGRGPVRLFALSSP
jgi:hypothetical protein